MRRGGTTLVVLVVAAIALAAGLDALVGGGSDPVAAPEPEPPPATGSTEAAPPEPAPAPGLGGTLYYTDASCELKAVELPEATAVAPPNWDECEFVLSPNGRRVSGAGTGWDPYSDPLIGRVYQSRDGTIQVSTNAGPQGEPFAGTAPAWKPGGTLTYFAAAAVREWPSGDVVLSEHEMLESAARELPLDSRPKALSVRESAWLSDQRLALIVDIGDEDMFGLFDGKHLVAWAFDEPGGMSDVRVSPGGRFAAAKLSGTRGQGQLAVLDAATGEAELPGVLRYHAIAWSPDDVWSAIAADDRVRIFPAGNYTAELELDLDARDLDWRGQLGPDAVSGRLDTSEASAWLARAGVGGLLYVTQQEGGSCRLRALEVPGLEWADTPDVAESPCRFGVDADGNVTAGGGPGVALTPAGRPTYVSEGELFAGRPGDRPELLLSAAKLEEIVGSPAALEEVVWVDEERFWAVVRSEGADGIALMTTDALVYAPWFAAPRIEGLRVSASMVAAGSDRGVAILDDGGRRRLIFTNGRDVDWAPGELIAAVSTRDGLLFVAPVTGESVSLPLEVADLEWVTR
ncbi:MAG TPA: hypothetical protein VD769_05830 [Gaiellaceae bacterium]|nr:hypothetical protein [Gaiellaceae bacterium]